MSAATRPDRNPLFEMETPFLAFSGLIRVVEHLASSPNELESDDLYPIANTLEHCHDQLHASWQAASDQRRDEQQAHERALAEAKAAAAPRWPVEAKRVETGRAIMLATARSVLEACDRTEERDGAKDEPAAENRGFQHGGFF